MVHDDKGIMRRKVLQDFANLFPQWFIDLTSGYDVAAFVHYGSGSYQLDILTGQCTRDGIAIPSLATCRQYREWLEQHLKKHNVPPGLAHVRLSINVVVSEIQVKKSYGHVLASAHFDFDCHSEIATAEKTYCGHMRGAKTWGFDWPDEKLYGSPLAPTGDTARDN